MSFSTRRVNYITAVFSDDLMLNIKLNADKNSSNGRLVMLTQRENFYKVRVLYSGYRHGKYFRI